MFTRLKNRIYEILRTSSESPNGRLTLGVLAFAEASFFPVPVEYFLTPVLLAAQRVRWFWWASFMTAMSVAGGIFGYAIGLLLFDSVGTVLVSWYGVEEQFERIRVLFDQNVFWAVFLAGITPIPYKIATIGAGLFAVNFPMFFLASVLSRALKFFLIVYGVRWVGRPVVKFIGQRSDMATAIAIVVTALVLFLIFH